MLSSIQYVFDKTVQTKVQQLANQRAATVTQVRQDLGLWTLDLGRPADLGPAGGPAGWRADFGPWPRTRRGAVGRRRGPTPSPPDVFLKNFDPLPPGLALGPAAGCTLVRPEGGFGRGLAGRPGADAARGGRAPLPTGCFLKNFVSANQREGN